MKKILFVLILKSTFLILNSFCFAQNKTVDSLLTLLKTDKPDTCKVTHLNNLAHECYLIGNFEKGLNYGMQALELAHKLNFKKEIATANNNIGKLYLSQADYKKALDYFLKALTLDEELKNKKGISWRLNNIGIIYEALGDYPKALDNYFKALKISEELGDKNTIEMLLGNIGNIYFDQKNYTKALGYFLKALRIAEDLGDKSGAARNLNNTGNVYNKKGDYSRSFNCYFKALKIAEELGDKYSQTAYLANIGSLFTVTGKFKEAEKYLNRSVVLADSIGLMANLMQSEESLSRLYDTVGRHRDALIHYKKAVALKDTIFSQENKKQLVRKEMNFEFDKKEAATKAENDKKMAVAGAESKRQKLFFWLIAAIASAVAAIAILIFRSLRLTRKQKQLIEIKNIETEHQKKIIEEKNKDITDSIRYAKRIQDALLREEEHISNLLLEHFILFMPKDIVSGDFYWGAEKDEYWYFAAVDCTGHGVPGAVMSMLGISFLNEIVSQELLCPSEILNRLRDKVVKELRQTGEAGGSKDGMDISLARLNVKTNILQWAGANNSLNLIQNGQLKIVKADKQPIGYHPNSSTFTNHEVQLQKGDSIYLYSDGYADQFGGTKGKKFKYKQLDNFIITHKLLPMKDQKEILKKRFMEWKGNLEQVDDVCVFGVRI